MIRFSAIHIFLLVILIDLSISVFDDTKDCRVDINNKKHPGHVSHLEGCMNETIEPIKKYNFTNFTYCKRKCIEVVECQVAEYKHGDCKLFNDTKYIIQPNSEFSCKNQLFVWKFCDLTKGNTGMVEEMGFWFYAGNGTLLDKKNFTRLISYSNVLSLRECKRLCYEYEMCRGFNFWWPETYKEKIPNNCQLFRIWNTTRIFYPTRHKHKTGKKRGYYFSFQEPPGFKITNQKICWYNKKKPCIGKSVITYNKPKSTKIIEIFHTRQFKACYKACERMVNCDYAIYNYKGCECVLIPTDSPMTCRRDYKFKIDNNSYVVEWTCCKHSKLSSQLTKSKKLPCHEIINPNYVHLKPYNCLSKLSYNSLRYYDIPVYKNQAFRLIKQINHTSLVTDESHTMWLVNTTKDNFPPITSSQCKYYSAKLSKKVKSTFISLSRWYPVQIMRKDSLKYPIIYIRIDQLKIPGCLATVNILCWETILNKQLDFQSRYKEYLQANFIICPTGFITEVGGWNYSVQTLYSDKRFQTIVIWLLGDYILNYPTLRSIRAIKDIIRVGLRNNLIDKNYRLQLNNADLTFSNMIRVQDHYNNITRNTCNLYHKSTVYITIAFVVVIFILLIILSNLFYTWTHFKICKEIKKAIKDPLLGHEYIGLLKGGNMTRIEGNFPNLQCYTSFELANKNINLKNCEIVILTQKSLLLDMGNKCLTCSTLYSATLNSYIMRNSLFDLRKLCRIRNKCLNPTVVIYFYSQSILNRCWLVVVHCSESQIVFHIKYILSSFLMQKNHFCFCRKYDIKYINSLKVINSKNNYHFSKSNFKSNQFNFQ